MNQQETQPAGNAGARPASKIEEVTSRAKDLAEDAKRQGREKLDSGKHAAADQTEKVADAVERAAQELANGEQQSLAEYAGQLATSVRTLAENLREKSIDELLRDTQQLARNNPTLFFVGSVVVGVAVSRFLKASGEPSRIGNQATNDDATAQPAVQPVTFEPDAARRPEASPKATSALDSPSFGDNDEKGV